MAINDFGGVMQFKLSTGQIIKVRGTAKINPVNATFASVVNQDGSVSRTVTPAGYRFSFEFEDLIEGDWNALMLAKGFNATFTETHTGRIHMWTDAAFLGDPEVDRLTGAVSGVTGISTHYRAVN